MLPESMNNLKETQADYSIGKGNNGIKRKKKKRV